MSAIAPREASEAAAAFWPVSAKGAIDMCLFYNILNCWRL